MNPLNFLQRNVKPTTRTAKKLFGRAAAGRAMAAAVSMGLESLEERRLLSGAVPVAVPGGPYSVAEGSSITIDGTGSTDADNDITQYKWDLNYNGTSFHTQVSTASFAYQPADNFTARTIALKVFDSQGNANISTTTLTATNVAPTIGLTGASTGTEGQAYTLNWTATDPGADTVSGWSVNWGDSQTTTYAGTATGATHTFTSGANYTITVSATDEDGTYNQSKSITVTNVTPVVTVTGATTTNEGSAYAIGFTAVDAGGNTIDSWALDWGDGTTEVKSGSVHNATHTYTDNANRTVSVTAIASDGDTGDGTKSVQVLNVAPSVTMHGTPASQAEGSSIHQTTTVTDPGSTDTFTYAWTVSKNGSSYTLPGGVTTNASDLTWTPNDNGTYVVTVNVTDSDGATTPRNSTSITITNANPTATVGGEPGSAINEGAAINLTATASDVGTADTFSYAWSVTKGGAAYTLAGGTTTNASTFSFNPNDNGTYVATVVVTDDDGGTVSVASTAITVNNVAPTSNITGEPLTSVDEGSTLSLGAHPTDAGSADTFTYAWTVSKDGSAFTLPGGVTTNAQAFSMTFADNGSYVAHCTVTDDDGGSVTTNSSTVTVNNVAPDATYSTSTTTGLEGTALHFTPGVTDAGSGDTFSYAWTVTKDGSAYTLPGGTVTNASTFTFTPSDNGAYVVSFVVTDDDGGSDTLNANVTVANADPVPSISGTPGSSVAEGATINLGSSVADAGVNDTVSTYAWTITKNGLAYNPGGLTLNSSALSFAPTDNGAYIATLNVTDNDGGQGQISSSSITVTNVAPTAAVSGEPGSAINEGAAINLTAAAADAGTADTFTYAWTVTKNGNAYTLPNGTTTNASSFSFNPNDNGTYVATVVVTDDDGGHVNASSTSITVNNVAPTATIGGEPVSAINEGAGISLTATPADAGTADTFSYAWSVTKGGSAYTLPGGTTTNTAAFAFNPNDNGLYVATCVVTDDDGATVSVNSQSITVNNVAPTATVTGEPGSAINEGGSVSVTAHPSDAGTADTFTYAWTVTKNGSAYALPGGTTTNAAGLSFSPNDNGSFVATCVVSDDDGATVSVNSTAITVNNVVPTGTIAGEPGSAISEGATVNVTMTASDAGTADTISYAWTVTKNGSAYTLPGGTTTNTSTFSFAPNDNGTFVATCAITDDDGGTRNVSSAPITVNNVAPTANVSGTPVSAINEGASVSLTSTASDAGTADTLTYSWAVTKNGSAFALPNGATTNASSFSFTPTDNGTYVATLTVSDDDGGAQLVSTSAITVNNVAPTATIGGEPGSAINEGAGIAITATAADAGTADTFTYAWTVTKGGNAYTLPGGTATNAASLSFNTADNGTYVATCVVTDDDGATVNVVSNAITVNNVAPVSSINGSQTTGAEGTGISLDSTVTDAGTADTETYGWAVTKNGNAYGSAGTGATYNFTPTDNGSYVVTLTVTDDDGGSSQATRTLTVSNVAPTGTIDNAGSDTLAEGSTASVTTTVTDAGSADTIGSYAWTVTKDGNAFTLPGGTTTNASSFSFAPNDNGAYVINCVVTDDDGGAVTLTRNLTVTNANPTGTISGTPGSSIDEGAGVTVTANAADAGTADTLTYAWHVTKNGNAFTLPGGTATNAAALNFTPTDNGSYVATCVVTDDDGGAVTLATTTITVDNVAPTAGVAGDPTSSNEGTAIALTGTAADSGTADTLTYSWHVTKNGNPFTLPNGTNTTTNSFSFTPTDNGTYVATVTVTDDDGASTNASTGSITVNNVAPTASINAGASTGVEGTTISLNSTAADVGSADTLGYAWTVTKDGDPFSLPNGTATNGASFAFVPTDNGAYVIHLAVTDDDGATTNATVRNVNVANANPTGNVTGDNGGQEGSGVAFTANTSDAGADDTIASYAWTVTRNGDSYDTGDATNDESDFSFTPDDNGAYVVSCVVTDNDGGHATITKSLNIANVDPSEELTPAQDGDQNEGTELGFDASVEDPAGSNDTISYHWDVTRDGEAYTVEDSIDAGSSGFAFTPRDNGDYVVTCTVSDEDGGETAQSTEFNVNNVNPDATVTSNLSGAVFGQVVRFDATGSDAGSEDALRYRWDFGDGSAIKVVDNGDSNTQQHAFAAPGTYTVRLTVSDDDGGRVNQTRVITVVKAGMQQDPANSAKQALFVGGSSAADNVKLYRVDNNRVKLVDNGVTIGNFAPTGKIYVLAGNGANSVSVASDVKMSVVAIGGTGADTFTGGGGDDVFVGSTGNDTFAGGAGRDLLIGGAGADVLNGEAGEDILVAGTTTNSDDLGALGSIMKEWSRTDLGYADRLRHVRSSTGGLNGSVVLGTNTQFSDVSIDKLTGGADRDWFMSETVGSAKDQLKDQSSNEISSDSSAAA